MSRKTLVWKEPPQSNIETLKSLIKHPIKETKEAIKITKELFRN